MQVWSGEDWFRIGERRSLGEFSRESKGQNLGTVRKRLNCVKKQRIPEFRQVSRSDVQEMYSTTF